MSTAVVAGRVVAPAVVVADGWAEREPKKTKEKDEGEGPKRREREKRK